MPNKKIAIIGATGFVGKHLVESLTANENYEISVLVHKTLPPEFVKLPNLEIVRGNLLDRDTLEPLIKNASIVINLSFPRNLSHSENLLSIQNILNTCIQRVTFYTFEYCSCRRGSLNLQLPKKLGACPLTLTKNLKLDIEDLIVKKCRTMN